MKTSSLIAALLLAGMATSLRAQSGVTLYGLVDLAVRTSDGQGPGGDGRLNATTSGGLSPSRWGINVSEDLGGGLRAIANVDHRFQADTGNPDPGPFFQQSWVGLQDPRWGRVTLGRQYNLLFDLSSTTFAAFLPIGPFLNAYKPDVALALGVRNDNQVKYQHTMGPWTAALQASFGEKAAFSTTTGTSHGGMLRYASGPIALGAGVLRREDASGRGARALLVGGAWTQGPIHLNASFARNRFDDGLNTALLLIGTGAENVIAPLRPGQAMTRASQRDMWSVGGTFRVAPLWRVGAQFWAMEQRFHAPGAAAGKGRFAAVLASYSLSVRTDLYASLDHTSLTDLQLTNTATGQPNGMQRRTSAMAGMRHRF